MSRAKHQSLLPGPNNLRWDEWVPEMRLLKLNEAGFAKRRALLEAQTKKNRPVAAAAAEALAPLTKGKDAKGKKGESSRKRARDAGLDTVSELWHAELTVKEAEFLKRPEVKIVIPQVLKLQLVDDWENVTKNNQLVTLPRKPSVRDLLQEYKAYVQTTKKERSP